MLAQGSFSIGMDALLRILLLSLSVWISNASHCTFPKAWRGTWYQSGVAQGELQISKHSISQRGHCAQSQGNKFLLLDRDKMCFVCLVFTPQHQNLLQFKESYCTRDDKLRSVCGRITGDNILHTIVKVPSIPEPCPFQGSYWFTYNNQSNRDCVDPQSEIQECADRSKFIFKYKHCRNDPATYDQNLKFQCLATWFNGERFLYGKFTGPGLTEQFQMYRCFMHSFWGTRGEMAMSADPTCQGLQSARVGYVTMNLSHRTDKWLRSSCIYPEFLTASSEWRNLGGDYRVVMDSNNQEFRILKVDGHGDDHSAALLSVRCMSLMEDDTLETDDPFPSYRANPNILEFVTYTTNDSCISMYQCLRLKKRGPSVVELMLGTPAADESTACKEWSFDNVHKYVLIPLESKVSDCPFPGTYPYVDKMSDCRGKIEIGCGDPTIMIIEASCPTGLHAVEYFQCNQNWTDSSTGSLYFITSKPGDMPGKVSDCLVYKRSIDGFEIVADEECGGGNLRMMNKAISVIIQPPAVPCRPPKRKDTPHQSTRPNSHGNGEPARDIRGGRDNRGHTNRNDIIDKKDITVINSGCPRTYSVHVTLLCMVVTLLTALR